jgi:serine/threonine protein kinase
MHSELPEKIGAYRVLSRIAVGGMGEVLLGHDDGLDRPVAIKRIRAEVAEDSVRRRRFEREARLAAKLDHSAIVRVYDFEREGPVESIVMEYAPGKTLRFLLKVGPFPVRYALMLAIEIADGLAHAHERGVLHRDLKTENVLVTEDAHAKILDFGIAKWLLAEDEGLTHSSTLLGTCRAMSPEQAFGLELDQRSDLFSFGTLLYEVLTGISPFETVNDLVTLKRLSSDPHKPLLEVDPSIPAELAALVDDLLEKKPEDRPRDAYEVRERLIRIAFHITPGFDIGSFVKKRSRWRRSLFARAWRALSDRFEGMKGQPTAGVTR